MRIPPAVLVFAGNDPSGGAGIQADIEALAAQGCHALPVLTCLTVQDTRNVLQLHVTAPTLVQAQARAVVADIPPAVCKIGLLGSVAAVRAVATILDELPGVPVVADPVLAAGGGAELSDGSLLDAMRDLLLPRTTVLTPNSVEARRLGQADTLPEAAQRLLAWGCRYVLITGTHERADPEVNNTLYADGGVLHHARWPRLPAEYHGSGCTLASALAGRLARGDDIISAVQRAQYYTWHSLRRAYPAGHGQWLPRRLPVAEAYAETAELDDTQ